MRRALVYLAFCGLGLVGGEGLSANAPLAVLLPPFYLLYGTLYVLFLDTLVRYRVGSWTTVYGYGVLVGYVTESFAAKVMFFGWPDNACNPGGILPLPEFPLLTFFFHPLFSFLLPVYLAQRFLRLPLALREPRWAHRLLPLTPLFFSLQVVVGGTPQAVGHMGLALVALALYAGAVRRWGAVADLRLPQRARRAVGVTLVLVYVAAFFLMPPFGRTDVQLPGAPQVVVALLLTALFAWVVRRRLPPLPPDEPVPYDPGELDLRSVLGALACFAVVAVAGVLAATGLGAAARSAWIVVFLGSTVAGTLVYARMLWRALRGRA